MIKLEKKRPLFFILTVSMLGLFIKIFYVWANSAPFTFDQARDILDLREMALLHKLRLIGATTSLHGVFYGPFWYWLSLPFYLLSGYDPMSTLYLMLGISFITPIILYFLTEDKRLGLILSLLFIFSEQILRSSVIALNTNPVVFIIPILIFLTVKNSQTFDRTRLVFIMLLSASLFHFEPVIGVAWPLAYLFSVLYFRNVRDLLSSKKALLAFFVPFIPQLFFEFRHNFLETRAFLDLVSGKGDSLSQGSGDLLTRVADRFGIFNDMFYSTANRDVRWVLTLGVVIVVATYILRIKAKENIEARKLLIVTIITLLSFFLIFVIYPYALWFWYLSSLSSLFLIIIGISFYCLFTQSRKIAYLSSLILAFFLIVNIFKYLPLSIEQIVSEDTASLRTRVKVVDLIYNDIGGKGMKIYTFAPYVYDYPYQYLIWWRVLKKYKYLPEGYYYLADQTPYVVAKNEADDLLPKKKSECDYLIIEPFESQEKWYIDWRGRFPDAKISWNVGRTRVEKLCQ